MKLSDLFSNPARDENASMAAWYDKQAIICKTDDAE